MRLWALVTRHAFDAIVTGLAVLAEIEVWTAPVPGSKPLLVVAMLAATLPLLGRRRFPFAASASVCATLAALTAVDPRATASTDALFYALALSQWSVAWHTEARQALAGLATGLATVVVVTERDPTVSYADSSGIFAIIAATWLVAFVLGP